MKKPLFCRGFLFGYICRMFGAIRKVCNNIISLDENKIFVDAAKTPEIKKYIIYLNAFDQLFLGGINSDGEIIGTYSNASDSLRSSESFTFNGLTKRKIAGDAYFFYDTGSFLKSFSVSIKKDGFTIKANDQIEDEHFGSLTEKFGKKIIGLTDESKAELGIKMLPILSRLVRSEVLK